MLSNNSQKGELIVKKIKEKPYTSATLFNEIIKMLEAEDKIPDILDYKTPSHEEISIYDYQFDFCFKLDYGSNEGIYLTCYIEGIIGKENKRTKACLGVFKTLGTTEQDMYVMAKLEADFIMSGNVFINNNLDGFTWKGADVKVYTEENEYSYGYTCPSMERAEIKAKEVLEKGNCAYVVIRNNEIREFSEKPTK